MAELVDPGHRSFITKKIRSILPHATILAFGSRIRGDAKKYSDLDIAIDDGQAVSLAQMSQFQESFAQSEVPYKIDLVDLNVVDEEFKKRVLNSGVRW